MPVQTWRTWQVAAVRSQRPPESHTHMLDVPMSHGHGQTSFRFSSGCGGIYSTQHGNQPE
jgi:hypothetical protein